MSAKYLINCQDGFNNLERATITFILAVSASKQAEVGVFVTADAASLCLQGAVETQVAEGYEPIGDLINNFLQNSGKIWLCPACAKAKGINESDLIAGVEIAGVPKTLAFLESGAKLLA